MNQKTIRIGYFEEIKTVFSLAEGNLEQEYPNVMKSLQNTDYTMYQKLAPYLFYYFPYPFHYFPIRFFSSYSSIFLLTKKSLFAAQFLIQT